MHGMCLSRKLGCKCFKVIVGIGGKYASAPKGLLTLAAAKKSPDFSRFYKPGFSVDPWKGQRPVKVRWNLSIADTNKQLLKEAVAQQVDFYFSKQNLQNDKFLCSQMDADGWVPAALIASFKKVAGLIGDDQSLLIEAAKHSTAVELSADCSRLRSHATRR